MPSSPRIAVLLLDRREGSDPTAAAWHEAVANDPDPVEVMVVAPDTEWWTAVPTELDLQPTDLVVVADLNTVPGPGLLDRLRNAVTPGVDVVDARVIPVETTLVADVRRGPGQPGEPGEPQEPKELDERLAKLSPQLRVSGWCCLMSASTLARVGAAWGPDADADRGRGLRELAAAGAVDVLVEPSATVFVDVRVDEDEHLMVGPTRVADLEPAADASSSAVLHPALMPATSLGAVLAAVGVELPDIPDTEHARPFLTVVTRTQGRRGQCLEEMLTCLAGQTVRDFEVVLLCHRVTPEDLASTQRIVDALPAWLRDRVRVTEVERPGRASPLNDGFAAARGRYIAMLDDDDTVFAHWVETFRSLELEAPGRLLRAGTLRQDVIPLPGRAELCPVPVGNAYPDWPPTFELVDHLRANYSPCMSMAFPRGAFHDLGFRFDEALDTTEDWDFLVRVAGIVGAVSSTSYTSVYRWWLDQASSRSLHSKAEWEQSHRTVLDKIDETVILLPPGAARRFRETTNEGWDEAAALATSQHQVILELTKTAEAHDKAVELWESAERRAATATEKAKTWRAKLVKRTDRFNDRLALLREADELLQVHPNKRPDGSVFDLTMDQLRTLVEELRGRPAQNRPLDRITSKFRR